MPDTADFDYTLFQRPDCDEECQLPEHTLRCPVCGSHDIAEVE